MRQFRFLVFIHILLFSTLSAQKNETLDSVFSNFIESRYFIEATDTLSELFYRDSVLFNAQDLYSLETITREDEFPVSLNLAKWKLINWNYMPGPARNDVIEIDSQKKLFNRYEISIYIPLINPEGQERQNGNCCEDTHYIVGSHYTIKENKDGIRILVQRNFFHLNWNCVYFL